MLKLIFPFLAGAFLALPASAQTLDRIKETGQLNLGFRTDAAPLSFQRASGEPAGYAPQVCVHVGQAIANVLKMDNLQANFVAVDAANRFDKVANGDIDLLCGAATITLSRREHVDFSAPIFVDGTAILQMKGAPGTFADMAGKKLGVRGDTTTQEALENSLKSAGMEAEVVTFVSHDAGIAAMENKEIDAYFADQSILAGLFFNSDKADNFQMSNEILTIEKQGLALARGDAEFRLLVDTALSELYANGTMQKIFADAIPGVQPGLAMRALYVIAPTVE